MAFGVVWASLALAIAIASEANLGTAIAVATLAGLIGAGGNIWAFEYMRDITLSEVLDPTDDPEQPSASKSPNMDAALARHQETTECGPHQAYQLRSASQYIGY